VQQSIAVRHGQLSEDTQASIKSKTEKISKLFDRVMSIEVVVELKNTQVPEVEIMVSAEHKHDFVATAKAESLLAAVDSAVQKIEQQLRKYKDQVQQRHRGGGQRRQEALIDGQAEVDESTEE
jgi:putative sigma-54 modulation protein